MSSASMIKTQEQYTENQRNREENTPKNNHHSFYTSPFASNNCHESLVYVMPSDSVESANDEPITKNAGSRWREDETEALVEIWRDKICQTRWWKQSKGVRVNKEMWEEIAQLLAEREVFRTPSQCQIRMKNLLQYYRQTIDNKRAEKSWDELPEYFDIVDKIMSRRETNGSLSDENGTDDTENRTRTSQNHPYPLVTDQSHVIGNNETAGVTLNKDEINGDIEETAKENRKRTHENISTTSSATPVTRYGPYYQKYLHPSAPQYHANCYSNKESFPTSHWGINPNQCCDISSHKTSCNGSNMYPHMAPLNSSMKQLNRNFPSKPYLDYSQNENPNFSNHENFTSHCDPKHARNDIHQYCSNSYDKSTQSEQNNKQRDSIDAIQIMQEFMQLQHKQMEHLLEVEKKRLEIEERRLQEEKDAGNRNASFLMEAVKILAETFRNSELKKERKIENVPSNS